MRSAALLLAVPALVLAACGPRFEAPVAAPTTPVVAAPASPSAPVAPRPRPRPARQAQPAPVAAQGQAPAAVQPAPAAPAPPARQCRLRPDGPAAPLTGRRYDVLARPGRPVLAVKIENSPQARPHTGLDMADVVVEHVVEGGITRFTAMYHSCVPDVVGPVRSARPVDARFLPAFDPLLAISGARPDVIRKLDRAGIPVLRDGLSSGFYRQAGRYAPHNLFASPRALLRAGKGSAPAASAPGWAFARRAPAGTPHGEVTVRMSRASAATWRYDPDPGVYRRRHNGRVQTVTGGGHIGVANVVVLRVEHRDGGCCDTSGARYVTVDVTGSGGLVLLRDGVAVAGTWRKRAPDAPLELLDAGSAPLPLKPGRTWIMLAPA